MNILVEKLKQSSFAGDIAYDDASIEKYSRDASLFKINPELILFPRTVKDLQLIVTLVAAEQKAGNHVYITARSAGTDMSGGPLGTSIIVDFTKYFNKIIEVGADYAITEPGVYYRDFDKATLAKGLIMPSYPASRELCTVGGMTANNSGGEKTLLYGKTIDYVEELNVVLRDGKEYTFNELTIDEVQKKAAKKTVEGDIYAKLFALINNNYDLIKNAKPHVSKNSAGYYLWDVYNKEKGTFNLAKLFVGSQGTLGLITKIKWRLVKPHTHSRLLVVFLKDIHGLGDITNHLLKFKPESLESYDDHTFKFAIRFLPALAKHISGGLVSLFFKFIPEIWAVITGGIPKMIMMAEFTAETDEEAYAQALKAQESLEEFDLKTRVTSSPDEAQKYWAMRRESFNLLRNHSKNLRTAPFIDDFVVPPQSLPEFLPKLYSILDNYKDIVYTIQGHVGDGNFHIIPLMDMQKPHARTTIDELMHKVNTLVISYHGSITGEHNDGIVRTPYIPQMFGKDVYKLFVEAKNIFDPNNIFNPGKKVGGTWEYAMQHLDIIKPNPKK